MAIARLAGSDVVANAIILLNEVNGRRTLTTNEYRIFWNNLQRNSKDIQVLEEYVGYDEDLHEYFDMITLEGNRCVYRLKPMYTTEDLRNKFHAYISIDACILLSDKSLVNGLNDLTLEEENQMLDFKNLDEKYQLEIMRELFQLEKKKRTLEAKLQIVKQNSSEIVDDIMVETIFEKFPHISSDNLVKNYVQNKGR